MYLTWPCCLEGKCWGKNPHGTHYPMHSTPFNAQHKINSITCDNAKMLPHMMPTNWCCVEPWALPGACFTIDIPIAEHWSPMWAIKRQPLAPFGSNWWCHVWKGVRVKIYSWLQAKHCLFNETTLNSWYVAVIFLHKSSQYTLHSSLLKVMDKMWAQNRADHAFWYFFMLSAMPHYSVLYISDVYRASVSCCLNVTVWCY